MSSAASNPQHLRLVGTVDPDLIESWRQQRQARQEIIHENPRAAGNPQLTPTDPRWVLAANAYAHLQGSTLTAQRRERLMQTAAKIGLRPFDANLILAVVQDQARRGEQLDSAMPALNMIREPKSAASSRPWLRLVTALICAILANVFLVWWLTST